jgi:hypothetical protein
MRTRVFLNPSNNVLVGKYPNDAEHVHVVCDSTSGEFPVTIPDLYSNEQREFIFYNVYESGLGNNVTLAASGNQIIGINGKTHILAPLDSLSMVSDLKKRWLLSDVNH